MGNQQLSFQNILDNTKLISIILEESSTTIPKGSRMQAIGIRSGAHPKG